MSRNPREPHRSTEANSERTLKRIEQFQGKVALLKTWEAQPEDVQIENHDFIIGLRNRVRNIRNYLLHRADAKANL